MSHIAGVVPITPAQAALVREALAASTAATEKVQTIVSTLAAGHVPNGSQLHSVFDTELHFLVVATDAA